MTKAQAAALLLAGTVAGVGGKAVLDGVANAAPALPFTHAVDLRREQSADGGTAVHFTVYASERRADGGTKDIGQATACKPSETTAAGARSLMNVLAKECAWAQ